MSKLKISLNIEGYWLEIVEGEYQSAIFLGNPGPIVTASLDEAIKGQEEKPDDKD